MVVASVKNISKVDFLKTTLSEDSTIVIVLNIAVYLFSNIIYVVHFEKNFINW